MLIFLHLIIFSLFSCFLNFQVFLRLAIHQAFQYWSQHSELNFKEVCQKCSADLTIDFSELDHEDGNPFDGESGVLAHAYFPKG